MFGKIRASRDIDLSREIVILPERVRIIVRLLSVNMPSPFHQGGEGADPTLARDAYLSRVVCWYLWKRIDH